MNIRDYVDRLRQEQPTSPESPTPFGGVCSAGSGRTIGDGMYATAKVTGTLGMLALLIKAAPMLCISGAACLVCLRGCLMSRTLPAQPPAPAAGHSLNANQPSSHFSSLAGQRPHSRAAGSAQRVRRNTTLPAGEPSELTSRRRPGASDADHSIDPELLDAEPSDVSAGDTALPSPLDFQFEPYRADFEERGNRLLGALQDHAVPETPQDNPLFHLVGGRKFIGTSQQPGEPAARTKLSIDAIRERGRSITAHLSLVDRPRVRQSYTGLIEDHPLRLTLTPQRNPQEPGGIFLPYTSWQVGCPTPISLELAEDGKTLAGTSVSGEVFEFVATAPLSLSVQVADEDPNEFPGLSVHGDHQWRVARRNGTTLDDRVEYWCFEPTSQRGGRFTWTRDEDIHAHGTYSEQPGKRRLTIRLADSNSSRSYRALIEADDTRPGTCRICVAAPGAAWPAGVDRQYGTVFDLKREP